MRKLKKNLDKKIKRLKLRKEERMKEIKKECRHDKTRFLGTQETPENSKWQGKKVELRNCIYCGTTIIHKGEVR
jgi:hypothetical protein